MDMTLGFFRGVCPFWSSSDFQYFSYRTDSEGLSGARLFGVSAFKVKL